MTKEIQKIDVLQKILCIQKYCRGKRTFITTSFSLSAECVFVYVIYIDHQRLPKVIFLLIMSNKNYIYIYI